MNPFRLNTRNIGIAILLFGILIGFPLGAGKPVVLLSFDGLAADLIGPRSTPLLWKLAQEGWQGRGVPPTPSTTFNGHATLATGCWPEHHGIVANGFWDPQTGFQPYAAQASQLQREPLWVAATRGHLKAAVYMWPCGEGPWQGQSPWRLKPFQSRAGDLEGMAFVDQALQDGADLVMAYFPGVDREGHHSGPHGVAMRRRLRELDRRFPDWFRHLQVAYPGLRLVLTADHGMAGTRRRIRLPEVLDGLAVTFVAHGGSAYVYANDEQALASAQARLSRVGLTVWKRENLPEALHLKANPRVGNLVVFAPLGTWLAQQTGEAFLDEAKGRQGAHAYPSDLPAMHTWVLVLGAGKGNLGALPLWDVAPTLASWLGLAWVPAPDGHPFPALVPAQGSR